MNELQAIKERHSVRKYLKKAIQPELRGRLDAFVTELNGESGLNFEMRYDDPAGFDSKLAHYGSFTNVDNYLLLKGKDISDFEEQCGYYGEKFVIRAQMLGLNTCWAALTFNKKMVKEMVPAGERFCMVIAVGYGESEGKPHRGKKYSDVTAVGENAPQWFKNGVEAALMAPTAINQQKFKIALDNGKPSFRVSGFGFWTKADLGIIRYHFEVGAGDHE